MFEDSADAISFGREHYGYPSVFSDIDIDAESPDCVHVNLSWKGVQWASFWVKDLKEDSVSGELSNIGPVAEAEEGIFVHRYVPTTIDETSTGHADAEYDVVLGDCWSSSDINNPHLDTNDHTDSASRDGQHRTSSNAGIEILGSERDKLPTLHHIVDRLRELPIFEIVEATVSDQESSVYPGGAARIT